MVRNSFYVVKIQFYEAKFLFTDQNSIYRSKVLFRDQSSSLNIKLSVYSLQFSNFLWNSANFSQIHQMVVKFSNNVFEIQQISVKFCRLLLNSASFCKYSKFLLNSSNSSRKRRKKRRGERKVRGIRREGEKGKWGE